MYRIAACGSVPTGALGIGASALGDGDGSWAANGAEPTCSNRNSQRSIFEGIAAPSAGGGGRFILHAIPRVECGRMPHARSVVLLLLCCVLAGACRGPRFEGPLRLLEVRDGA